MAISQFLSDRIDLTDDLVNRLLSCAGYRLEVRIDCVAAELSPTERLSWLAHRQLAAHLTPSALIEWQPRIRANIGLLRDTVHGEPDMGRLNRWQHFVESGDLNALRRALIGVDRAAVDMREVSPMSGILAEDERHQVD